ncbi:MAG: Uma2 family endonuclease [Oscillatoriales cyanobacterium SM2_1_8]|nr:Uma2 family endonuclease [Oscillatoriales cyanobacterium SM2_1_8]
MMQLLTQTPLTAYFDHEVTAETRSEYIHGEMIPMAGGTLTHNTIITNLLVLVYMALRDLPYHVFVTDQRLWIPDRQMLTYPDILVTPEPPLLMEGRNDTVTNPILIAEVLSESTEAHDRGEKFAAYRTIPTLQAYLLISQTAVKVEGFHKEGDRWIFQDYPPEGAIALPDLSLELAIADIYRRVDFGAQMFQAGTAQA